MKKKVYANEVTWLMSPRINAGEQANGMLRKLLGPELADSFAPMSGGQYFVWEFPGDGWLAMSEVTEAEKAAVDGAFSAIGAAVRAKVNDPKLADTILELPSPRENYLFFRRLPDGSIRVMVTGWGCSSFARTSSAGHRTKVTKGSEKPMVRLSFMSNGNRIPGREFLFRFPYQAKPGSASTGEDGYYVFPAPQTPGMKIEITDCETGLQFDLIVADGTNDHVFDVTEEKPVEEKPDNGGDISEQSVEETAQGIQDTPHPAPEPHPAPGPDPAPELIVQVKACVVRDGIPVAGIPVDLTYRGNMSRLFTDEYGYVSRGCVYSPGQEVSASAEGIYRVQVISDGGNYFLFETFSPQPQPEPDSDPRPEDFKVYVYDFSGEPLRNRQVFMCQGDMRIPYRTDDKGCFIVGREVFETGVDMTAEFETEDSVDVSVPFRFEEDELIYHIVGRKEKSSWRRFLEILLLVLAAALLLYLMPWFVVAAETVAEILLN